MSKRSFFEEFKLQKNCEINPNIKTFLGLVENDVWASNVSFSLPQWQEVNTTFFAPWHIATLERADGYNFWRNSHCGDSLGVGAGGLVSRSLVLMSKFSIS